MPEVDDLEGNEPVNRQAEQHQNEVEVGLEHQLEDNFAENDAGTGIWVRSRLKRNDSGNWVRVGRLVRKFYRD